MNNRKQVLEQYLEEIYELNPNEPEFITSLEKVCAREEINVGDIRMKVAKRLIKI